MTTFKLPIEALALPMCGDDKRRIHFRVKYDMTPTGTECHFGFTEYLYCERHSTWHAQHNDAFVPIAEWSKLVSYTEHVDAIVKRNAEHLARQKTNGEDCEALPAKPIHKLDGSIPQPNPIQTLDESDIRRYESLTGHGPTGR